MQTYLFATRFPHVMTMVDISCCVIAVFVRVYVLFAECIGYSIQYSCRLSENVCVYVILEAIIGDITMNCSSSKYIYRFSQKHKVVINYCPH